MWHQVITYLQWLPKTFHLHGIHSPFVFQLEKQCLKNRHSYPEYVQLNKYRDALLHNDKVIEVTDFGAGSRIFKSNKRAVKAIATHAGAPLKRMQLLHRLVHYLKPSCILELGTSLGMATYAMSFLEDVKITSLEGCPATAKVARETLDSFEVTQVNIEEGRFAESILKHNTSAWDFIYFDGNHSKKATLDYVKELLPTATNETIWMFDDIHWSSEMTSAWEAIKKLPEVKITVDCFWFGLVFFRSEQAKEHFYINV